MWTTTSWWPRGSCASLAAHLSFPRSGGACVAWVVCHLIVTWSCDLVSGRSFLVRGLWPVAWGSGCGLLLCGEPPRQRSVLFGEMPEVGPHVQSRHRKGDCCPRPHRLSRSRWPRGKAKAPTSGSPTPTPTPPRGPTTCTATTLTCCSSGRTPSRCGRCVGRGGLPVGGCVSREP